MNSENEGSEKKAKVENAPDVVNLNGLSMNNYMDDYLKCPKCKKEDHEGVFCRCEDRNIRIAKERRARGESAWDKLRSKPLVVNK